MNTINVSIVVPVYNEEENVRLLFNELSEVLNLTNQEYEIIFINDGSSDNTLKKLLEINNNNAQVRIINLRKNFGQTAAMDAGFKNAKGKYIITMDGDLQNDPKDIPKLLDEIEKGYDVVSGWRRDRKDPFLKRFFSRGANILRKFLFNDRIHDSGCTLKIYKKECFDDIDLHGEMHRFIPALLEWKGFSIGEIVVKHRARQFGKTKYGMKRTVKGFLDMLVVVFWMKYSNRPMHIFGTIGIISGICGGVMLGYLTFIKLYLNMAIGNRPLLILGVLLIILSVQFIIFGLLADILIKIFYKNRTSYSIRDKH